MDLLQSFKNYLDLRQISYKTDTDVVVFNREGWNLMLIYDKDAPSYFRLALPRIEKIDNTFDIEKFKWALKIAGEYKVVKAVIIDGYLWFVFENFLPDYDNPSTKLFERAIRILVQVGNEWRRTNFIPDTRDRTDELPQA